ncbi:MAG: glycosyltransferase, partial [Gammaproteobacteria bacterium]
MGNTFLSSHHIKDNCNNHSQVIETNKLLQTFSFPEINPEQSEIPPRIRPAVLPNHLVAPQTRKNPYIDSSQPFTSINSPFKTSVDHAAQRQVNALLTYDESTQDRRLNSLLTSEAIAGLNKLGVSFTGNIDRGYYLIGNETGRKLPIPEAGIRYARIHFHNEKNILKIIDNARKEFFRCKDMDLGRMHTIAETLFRTSVQQLSPSTLNHFLNRYFLFGGNPTSVSQHIDIDSEAQSCVSTVAKALQTPLRDVSRIKRPKILLYTTKGGGGHFAHAQALNQHLKTLGLETVVMDHDGIYFDPLAYLTNGAASTSDSFNRVLQRRIGLDGRALKSDEEVGKELKLYDYIHNVLHKLTGAKNHFEIARHELSDPNYVALIDNLPSLTGIEGAAISNGLRYIRWPTDIDTWLPLLESYDVMDANQGKIATASADPFANREFSLEHRRKDKLSKPGDMWRNRKIIGNDSDVGVVNPNILDDPRLFLAGYPIRKEITKLPADERNALRSRLGLKPSDQMIIVMLGSQGKRELIDIMQQMLERPTKTEKGEIKLVFAVGANLAIKNELLNLASQNNTKNMKVHMADDLLGTPNNVLDAVQMNMLYNTADLLVSKPGGSVTAEILETETPTLMCALNRGEEGNASYLLRSGLGVMRDETIPFGEQAEAILHGNPLQLRPNFKLPTWRAS